MAKRRERRVPADSARRGNPVDEVVQTGQSGTGASHRHLDRQFIIFFIFAIVLPVLFLIVYRIKDASKTNRVQLSVYERGLVGQNVNYKQILAENSKVSENSSHRHYNYPVLAYITPWNSRGYELAKRFNSKFTHLSPVWYDLKSEGVHLVLEGRHNVDLRWISELRMAGHALVLPRVVLEASPMELLRKKKQRDKAIELILTECK